MVANNTPIRKSYMIIVDNYGAIRTRGTTKRTWMETIKKDIIVVFTGKNGP